MIDESPRRSRGRPPKLSTGIFGTFCLRDDARTVFDGAGRFLA
jgi:hypothetical protein